MILEYAKVAWVHYFCALAFRTPQRVLCTWSLHRIDSFYTWVILFWINFEGIKLSKMPYRHVWIRLITVYLLSTRVLRQKKNALLLQYFALFECTHPFWVCAPHTSKSQHVCIFSHKSLLKVNTAINLTAASPTNCKNSNIETIDLYTPKKLCPKPLNT